MLGGRAPHAPTVRSVADPAWLCRRSHSLCRRSTPVLARSTPVLAVRPSRLHSVPAATQPGQRGTSTGHVSLARPASRASHPQLAHRASQLDSNTAPHRAPQPWPGLARPSPTGTQLSQPPRPSPTGTQPGLPGRPTEHSSAAPASPGGSNQLASSRPSHRPPNSASLPRPSPPCVPCPGASRCPSTRVAGFWVGWRFGWGGRR